MMQRRGTSPPTWHTLTREQKTLGVEENPVCSGLRYAEAIPIHG